jgi:GNAT superfamily N-acetyltransferase
MVASDYRVERAGPEHGEALGALFATNNYGCFCRYWHFEGDHRQWLARCAHEPEVNRAEMLAALGARTEDAAGLVARGADGSVVGWMKLAPATAMGKLYGQRLYKGLPTLQRDPSGIWTVGCLFVEESARRKGVARALLDGAIESARAAGARALEAFPRGDTDVADAALMMGPLALFRDAGFVVVNDFAPYPVVRLELGAAVEIRK